MPTWKYTGQLFVLGLVILFTACSLAVGTERPGVTCPGDQLLKVPQGWFTMGMDDGHNSNQPQHQVYLDDFCIQKHEVTCLEFARFVAKAGYKTTDWNAASLEKEGDLPVTGVLWGDALAYCQWIGMRLPSEAEWEKAARGMDGRDYPWGDEWDRAKANTAESCVGGVLPVGSFPDGISPYGLLDMAGNAAEWVADYYDAGYYATSPDHNPTGPTQVLDHGLRGGSYDSPADWATTYFRDSSHSARPNVRIGFRCAFSPLATNLP